MIQKDRALVHIAIFDTIHGCTLRQVMNKNINIVNTRASSFMLAGNQSFTSGRRGGRSSWVSVGHDLIWGLLLDGTSGADYCYAKCRALRRLVKRSVCKEFDSDRETLFAGFEGLGLFSGAGILFCIGPAKTQLWLMESFIDSLLSASTVNRRDTKSCPVVRQKWDYRTHKNSQIINQIYLRDWCRESLVAFGP